MKWIVLEENPKPDEYIGVTVTDENLMLQLQGKESFAFLDGDEAID